MKFDEQPPVELDSPQGLHSAGQRLIYRNITPINYSVREQHHKLALISVPLRYLCILTISIQGVTEGMCETSGECSLGQTIPI